MSARTPKAARPRTATSSSAYPAARPSAASNAGIEAERAAQATADASAPEPGAAASGATVYLFRCPDCGRHHSEPAEAHWLLVVVCVDCAHAAAYDAAAVAG